MSDTQRQRCAVYTRKSHEEGLDQTYNSLDAQRDAGQAYIVSQRHEGWIPVAHDYDDPAYSGGNLERPALTRLLHDIQQGHIDVVVVYKIDRLTRSLLDFSKLIEVFDQHSVSFVSVTQQFNTTTSMGRLMLNVLLSFAQFEREVTGERIRDKISASKKKGLWMGGRPPLGYRCDNRQLVIDAKDAELVRHIFQRFVELGSTTDLAKELQAQGRYRRVWVAKKGRVDSTQLIDRSQIYKLLHNRVYIGKIKHQDQWYDGQHEALVEPALWERVQALLSKQRSAPATPTRGKVPFLLKGLIQDAEGRAFTPWSSVKRQSQKRYRYYVHTLDIKQHAGASGYPRLPAAQLEVAVLSQVRRLLMHPEITQRISQHVQNADVELDEAQITVALHQLDTVWSQLFPQEQHRLMTMLIDKIIVLPHAIELRLQPLGIHQVASAVTDYPNKAGLA